jgi:RNA polymerase sigma-70 factor, ECF subfamily
MRPIWHQDKVNLGERAPTRFRKMVYFPSRDMLADDVQLELVSRFRRRGRDVVQNYFGRYRDRQDWRLRPGLVEGRPAVIVQDAFSREVLYFVLLTWAGDEVSDIRDFRHARYAMEGAELFVAA